MKPLRVGMLAAGFTWGGGRDFLKFLTLGLAPTGADITVLVPDPTVISKIRAEAVRCRSFIRALARFERPRFHRGQIDDYRPLIESFSSAVGSMRVVHYPASRAGLTRVLAKEQIDIILPSIDTLGGGFPKPWLGYIFDLQHKYLPHLCSRELITSRDRRFQRMLRDATAIIVNSEQVKNDLRSFYDCGTCEVHALPFCPIPQSEWFSLDVGAAKTHYEIREPYFLISNQFWLHKDHATAFKALALMKNGNAQLVCTGSTSDYRDPEYFPRLEQLISDLGLNSRVKILGHIPKAVQIAIMRGAVAVIQSTLFEGGPGGGSVYEAVAMGVPAIVSDIPVNREISERGVTFFAAGSAEALASAMIEHLEMPRPRENSELLLQRGALRVGQLAAALTEAIVSVHSV